MFLASKEPTDEKGYGGSYEVFVWKGSNIPKVGNQGCQILF